MPGKHLRKKTKRRTALNFGPPPADGSPLTSEIDLDHWLVGLDHPSHRIAKRTADDQWAFAKNASGATLEPLRQVVGAQWKGAFYRIDGHARAQAWTKGLIPRPDTLRATIYFPKTQKEFFELYRAYHATTAVLNRLDEVQSAFREFGLNLKSRRLKHGLLVQAFSIALRGSIKTPADLKPINLRRAVEIFQPELQRFDDMRPSAEVFQTGLVSTALIGLTLYPKGAEFFERLAQEKGNKRDGLMDPVECVLSLIERIRYEGTATFDTVQEDLCERSFRAYLAYMRGDQKNFDARMNNTMKRYWFKRSIQAVDLEPYIARLRRKKKITGETDL